jgi:hypothetical protein
MLQLCRSVAAALVYDWKRKTKAMSAPWENDLPDDGLPTILFCIIVYDIRGNILSNMLTWYVLVMHKFLVPTK